MAQARRSRYIALASKERWIEAMAEHEELMAAMAARNSELAGKILFEHDSHTGNAVRDVLNASEEC
jgi:DNA-binding GntR family transcriptional regulator